MITTFKNWFNKNKPIVGDYVICALPTFSDESIELNSFIENNIGEIIYINKKSKYTHVVLYSEPPKKFRGGWFYDYDLYMKAYSSNKKINKEYKGKYVYLFELNQIKHYSKTKEDLIIFLSAKKYNI